MEVEDRNGEADPTSMESLVKASLLARNKLAIILKSADGVQFCCVQCPARYTEKEDLEKHLLQHNNQYRYLCGICGTGLKRKEHLDRHTLEHQQVRPHVCDICGKAFKRKEHLNIHRTIHSGDKNEVCMLCHKSFYRKDHLQKHLQTHSKVFMEQNISLSEQLVGIKAEVMELEASDRFDDSSQDQDVSIEDIIITPDQRPTQVDNLDQVNQSIDQSTNPDRPFACHLCDKTYKRKDHLKLHTQSHLKKDKICSECGKGFTTDDQLLRHMNVHVNIRVYPSVDGEDDKSQLHTLLQHHNIDTSFFQNEDNSLLAPRAAQPHADESARRHECDICHRKFKRRQHLTVHRNVHLKNQPNIWCSMCSKGFASNDAFQSHTCRASDPQEMMAEYLDIKIEHPPPDEEELDIKIAPPAEAKKENQWPESIDILPLKIQEDSTQYVIRDESQIPCPLRVYVCKFCQKPFKRKDHYKIHLHIHTGVKSFFCPDCGKGFYRKDHLQKHAQVHLRSKPKPKKALPDLFPISKLARKSADRDASAARPQLRPEITIHAPSNTKLRVPLQIKVPYQMVMSMDNGEQRAVTIDPHACSDHTN